MIKVCGGSRQQVLSLDYNINAISIIIVTRNAGNYIQQCLNSIISQKFQNIEILIFDGASTDDTIQLLKNNDKHITYWQSEPDKGIYDAMNKALKYATGDWFYFLGADDIVLNGFSNIINLFTNKSTIYYGDCLTDKAYTLNGRFSAYRLTKMNICHHAVFYPAVIFKKYNYPTEFLVYADYALNIQCWGDNTFIKKYLPLVIAKFHTSGFSATAKDELFKKSKKDWIKKYMSWHVYLRYCTKKWKESRKKNSRFFL